MSEPFIGEIKMFAGTFAPRGYAFPNGALLAINQNQALFSLFGTTYGGNGTTTFALPDLRSRTPLHPGNGAGLSPHVLGEVGGLAAVSLIASNVPSHGHTLQATTAAASAASPAGGIWAVAGSRRSTVNLYTASPGTGATMAASAIGTAGTGTPHNNMPPYLALNFIVATSGIFPTRN